MQRVQRKEQIGRGAAYIGLAHAKTDVITVNRRFFSLRIWRFAIQLVVKPFQKSLGITLRHQIRKQLLIGRGSQINRQGMFKGFKGRILHELIRRSARNVYHQRFDFRRCKHG